MYLTIGTKNAKTIKIQAATAALALAQFKKMAAEGVAPVVTDGSGSSVSLQELLVQALASASRSFSAGFSADNRNSLPAAPSAAPLVRSDAILGHDA